MKFTKRRYEIIRMAARRQRRIAVIGPNGCGVAWRGCRAGACKDV